MIFLPRWTVRRLMVAVAIAAALIWPAIFASKSLEYRRLAIHREMICSLLSSEYDSLAEQAQEAKSKGNLAQMNYLIAQAGERKKAISEESRAALVFRRAIWRPWREVRYR